MIKSSSIFLYIPQNQSSGIPYDRFGITSPNLIHTNLFLCIRLIPCTRIICVYPHHLSSAMRAFPS